MFVDLILACAHHIAIFVMAGALVAEFVLLRGLLDATPISRLSRADMVYGMSAGAIILIGIGRVLFGLKGWEYYVYNHAFWGKMGVILIVALLSGYPTMRIAAWRKSLATEPGYSAPVEEAERVRRLIVAQCWVFLAIPLFAAAMARGVGY